MPLTHVCVWESGIGYRRVTVEEACELYPWGASAKSGHFVCELCAQNVLLTAPGVNVRHFRHDSASQNKECEERQAHFDSSYGRSVQGLNSHAMPLRISVTGTAFSMQLGFFFPQDSKVCCDRIKIALDTHEVYEYSFERIERAGTTYLDVGTLPSRVYGIEYVNANEELKKFWSTKVMGVNATGSFFDGKTGKILQPGGKAYSENSYYLLQRCPLYSHSTDIVAMEMAKRQVNSFITWYLYKIRVKNFSAQAAKFFLKYAIFLTERPTRFYPVWPPYIKDPYFIYHDASEFYFYLCGDDAELKSFPATAKAVSVHNGRLYKLFTKEREQLVSFGKSGALGFSYLIRQPLQREASPPTVVISDQAGSVLTDTIYDKIPKLKLISVLCQYDGKAVVKKNDRVEYIYRIAAEQDFIIDGLSYGTEIFFYQGCDLVCSIRFDKKEAAFNASVSDDLLVKMLESCSGPMIPITHTIGTFANKYSAYPKTKRWLYAAARQGEISRKALQLLRDNTPNASRRG